MWCAESDSFRFRIELHDRPLTRRGVLSTIGSIYDPNGYLAPVTLRGKQILQQMCKDKLDWDSPVPEYLHPQWEKWRREIVWSIVYVYEVTKCSSRDCQFIGEFFLYKRIETFHESKRCCETTEVRPRDKFDWCTKWTERSIMWEESRSCSRLFAKEWMRVDSIQVERRSILVTWAGHGKVWFVVYATHLNHYCYKLAANLMMRHCEHSW